MSSAAVGGSSADLLETLKRAATVLQAAGIPFALAGSGAAYARGAALPVLRRAYAVYELQPRGSEGVLTQQKAHG
jgi:hypothetical protein